MTNGRIVALLAVFAGLGGIAYFVYRSNAANDGDNSDDSGNEGDGASATDSAQPSLGTDPVSYVENAIVGQSPTLGMSINNPGNLRYIAHNPWNGQIGNYKGFGQYSSLELGTRAMGKQLLKYFNAGNNTVRSIVSIYAPSTENDTDSYINQVAAELTVLPDDPIDLPARIGPLMYAMIAREQGSRPIDVDTLQVWGTEL